MAPEFFPFIGFGLLVCVLVSGLAAALVLCVVALVLRRLKAPRWARWLVTALCGAAVFGAVVVAVGLVWLGGAIRQQYFLNEPLVTACASGDMTKTEKLLSSGASPDSFGIDFIDTALSAAAAAGHREIVALLLRRGAHVELKDSDGKTAAERARENGHDEIAEMLDAAKDHPPKT